MSDNSAIEWTDATWNPIVGCTIVSPGCTNCYAMKQAARMERMFAGTTGAPHYRWLTKTVNGNPVWIGKVALAPDKTLAQPLRWKAPRRIFVNSMGDLFHESIPDEWIDRVLAVMALAPQHTFQVLTKRAARMREYFIDRRPVERCSPWGRIKCEMLLLDPDRPLDANVEAGGYHFRWPLPNVWLGASAERQQEADERIPLLLQTPAAVRFVSCEPLLGPIDLRAIRYRDGDADVRIDALTAEAWVENSDSASAYTNEADGNPGLDWIIVGGESGKDARPMHPQWARDLRDQCGAADVAFFFKQWGEWTEIEQFDPTGDSAYHWDKERYGQPAHRSVALGFDGAYGHDAEKFLTPTAHVYRVGKKAAGRLLDGRAWNEFPASPLAPIEPRAAGLAGGGGAGLNQ